jgi:hypothetical protein
MPGKCPTGLPSRNRIPDFISPSAVSSYAESPVLQAAA